MFPALRLPSESSSLTLLFLYSATTTLYFFLPLFLSSVSADYALQLPTYQPTNYRPAGGVKLSNPAERRRMMKFFLCRSSYRCIIIKYMLHPTSKPTLVLNLMDEKNAQTPLTIRLLLSSHHHPSNPIATEKSRTASLRLDLPVCTLVIIQYSQTFQQGTLLHESHPRWHSCMCKKKVETSTSTAQDRTGAGLLPTSYLLPRWACLRKISSGSGCSLFLFFLSTRILTFFRYYDARR